MPVLAKTVLRALSGFVIVVLPIMTGCARVNFYSDEQLKKRTGVRYYAPKPYLLVSRTGNKDKPVDVSVIYLPNLADPQYAVYKPGWGSHQFTLAVNNGMLTSYGQTADSKMPETITAVGSLLSAAGTGFKGGADAYKVLFPQFADIGERRALAMRLMKSATDLRQDSNDPNIPLAGNQKQEAVRIAASLDNIAKQLNDPNATPDPTEIGATLKTLSEAIEKLKIPDVPANPAAQGFNNRISSHAAVLSKASAELAPPVPQSAFELYEIRMVGDVTSLRPVGK